MLMPGRKNWEAIETSIEGLYPPPISDGYLILMPKDGTLEKMAIAKMNEGIEYRKDRNREKSIECYRFALSILSSDDPVRAMRIRARILINLGNAYLDPIRGFQPDDIRLAIYAYQFALAVFSKANDLIDWARAKMNLGAAYGQYAGGNRQDNIERSIEASQQSLEILSFEKEPEDWANALMNLGTVYTDRIKGDRSVNILKAIDCLRKTWRVWKRKIHPHRWAIVMGNFGNAHLSKNFDDRSNSIEVSIKSYNQALRVFDKKICAYDWSLVKTNLGNAYLDRIKGNPNQNIELAINAYRDALEVRTQENMPLDWAIATMNLGQAYLKDERIEDAILSLNLANSKIECEKMPLEWAKIKAALGRAYLKRSEGNKEENIATSIKYYQYALRVFRADTFPHLCRAIAIELGDLYFDNQQWDKSSEIYKIAVQSDEILYQASLLSISKEAVLKETGNLYRRVSYSLAKSAQLNDAVVFLERGRARILGDVLAHDRADLDNVRSKNQRLYNEYIEASTRMRNLDSKNAAFKLGSITENIWVQAEKAHAHLIEVIESIRTICGYENFLKEANWIDILEVVRKEKSLVYLVATSRGGLGLIIYRSNDPSENDLVEIKSIWLDEFSDQFLDAILNKKSIDFLLQTPLKIRH